MRRQTGGPSTPCRRQVVGLGIAAVATAVGGVGRTGRVEGGGSVERGRRQEAGTPEIEAGRISARPGQTAGAATPGLHPMELDRERDALLFVPVGYRAERPAPFVLSLHGAGGDAQRGLYPLGDLADEAGLVILAPASRGRTWDAILGGFGPDVAVLDRALAAVFGRVAVDPARIGIAGFSDGASYALSLGLTNGDLFGDVLAFSPGFAAPGELRGEPRVFVSHGAGDDVLPIDVCSRRIVPRLEEAGYDVEYREFDGGHTVPAGMARAALDRFLTGVGTPAAG